MSPNPSPVRGLAELGWPRSQLHLAVEALVTERRLGSGGAAATSGPGRAPGAGEDIEAWLGRAVARYDLEATAVDAAYDEVESLLDALAPALVPLGGDGPESFLVLLPDGPRRMRALGPGGASRVLERRLVREVLCSSLAPHIAALERRLERAGASIHRRSRVLDRTVGAMLSSDAQVGRSWLVRPSSGGSFWGRLRREGLLTQLGVLLGMRMSMTVLFIVAWVVLGSVSLGAGTDRGIVVAWGLMIGTVAMFQISGEWIQSTISIHVNRLLRRRLLQGTFHLDVDELRSEGAGSLFGRVIDADRLHGFAIGGGFEVLAGVFQLVGAMVVLLFDPLLLALTGVWAGAVVVLGRRLHRKNRTLTRSRISLTHDIVDGMVGYRTRLVQEHPDRWHAAENARLGRYLGHSERFDRASLVLGLVPGAWQIATFAVLGLRFASTADTETSLWLPLGGVLLVYGAMRSFADGVPLLSMAAMAWEQVAPLVAAPPAHTQVVDPRRDHDDGPGQARPLLDLQGVRFEYPGRPRPVLSDCRLEVSRGDRLLLQGPSGGGKSTLGALICGLRAHGTGTILLDGLDRHALGFEAWRSRVVSCPQFHENHVFADTMAFNLLMARAWPPSEPDLDEAREVCEELGLGPLLERMPLGIQQIVGETGWRLSHGERSRMFIARALLTRADVLVLDESFAALDPQTLHPSVECVLRRSQTVLVIAHP
ncbi:MAG: ABC transporter ATP-binding protein [Nannocystaceae bacterium]